MNIQAKEKIANVWSKLFHFRSGYVNREGCEMHGLAKVMLLLIKLFTAYYIV